MSFLIYSVEDDKDISQIINKTLSHQGYQVVSFYDGNSFLEAFKKKKPDMVLLDMMLPDYSGSDILKIIRNDSTNDDIEVIIVSANRMVMDKVDGFDLGADDYIEKPFDLLELMSRVGAKFRRHKKKLFNYKDIFIDIEKRTCFIGDESIDLTNKEFDILVYLLKNKGKVISREELFSAVWNNEKMLETRTIDMHIKSLRNKIEKNYKVISTVYGIGYKVLE
jgi:two-component system alkaline phosphatase synthesis response regulator PhoP